MLFPSIMAEMLRLAKSVRHNDVVLGVISKDGETSATPFAPAVPALATSAEYPDPALSLESNGS